jgi:uncharacterized membrane protein YhiD involved in acid resistance
MGDIFKDSVLDKLQAGELTVTAIAITLGIALAMGVFIYFIYRLNTRNSFYNRSFNKSLAILPVITATIMLAMGSNLTISLGMVGALSIVRFRNAVKDPCDLTYLFWSITLGIVIGAGLFELAILLSLAATILVFVLDLIPSFRAPCLLVVSGENAALENAFMYCVKTHTKAVKIRSRNISTKGAEWILELRVRKENDLVQQVAALESVRSVHMMTHDGEVRF